MAVDDSGLSEKSEGRELRRSAFLFDDGFVRTSLLSILRPDGLSLVTGRAGNSSKCFRIKALSKNERPLSVAMWRRWPSSSACRQYRP
jgi:hypothetical protein